MLDDLKDFPLPTFDLKALKELEADRAKMLDDLWKDFPPVRPDATP